MMPPTLRKGLLATACSLVSALAMEGAAPADPPERDQRGVRPMLEDNISRALRYEPRDGGFLIVNGRETFNRPLYGGGSPFRVDAGDRPEFVLYLPGRGGNLRIALSREGKLRWLHEAAHVESLYKDGMMHYLVRDPLLGSEEVKLRVTATHEVEGVVFELDGTGLKAEVGVFCAFGGLNGERGGRDGDIGCERLPVREFFQYKPEYSAGNVYAEHAEGFSLGFKTGAVRGVFPMGVSTYPAAPVCWNTPAQLVQKTPAGSAPLGVAQFQLAAGTKQYFALQNTPPTTKEQEVLGTYREVAASTQNEGALKSQKAAPLWTRGDLATVFARELSFLQSIARRVQIQTPDPYLNSLMPALNVAASAVWDERSQVYVHGGVAWRVPLLGWRVSYAGDTLGWHERTRQHFDLYAKRQNTSAIPERIPAPEAVSRLARNEDALHSNGDMTKSHYDMNMVGVDAILRHLLWTGDLDYARKIWPVIERHLAWERRLFRREYAPGCLPLYEAYACIWASDDLAYNGGGATHSSAYNLFHHRMAARIARLIGQDASLYEREADLLSQGIQQQLWLPERGWYAEWKDLLGLGKVHPQAAAWTVYHTIDSRVPNPLQAWQMTRYVEAELPRIPVKGAGVPSGNFTLSTTNWMPYTWSLNNVVMGESAHTALSLWQANRPELAFPLLKGAVLDSMYLGICPGNVGMCTWYDATRRESQRDFADGVGILARTVVEGLFGVQPDLLAGEVLVRPGFPKEWNSASLMHPGFSLQFKREGGVDHYTASSALPQQATLRLQVPAAGESVAEVLVNGRAAAWRMLEDSVAVPRIEVLAAPSSLTTVSIRWSGASPVQGPAELVRPQGADFSLSVGARILGIEDPQKVLTEASFSGAALTGRIAGLPGHRTLFVRVAQGGLRWLLPVSIEVQAPRQASVVFVTDWSLPVKAGKLHEVSLGGLFNDKVTRIFANEYRTPRSPFCSLAVPLQGIGSWCKPQHHFDVKDEGLRAAAAKQGGRLLLPNQVPLATPGDPAAANIAFVSQWDNYPRQVVVPLEGRARRLYLLMAGSTWAMHSRTDNGELVIDYTDGTQQRVALENPSTWWPIDQDYFIDDYAFRRPGPLPLRVDLATGTVRVLEEKAFKGRGRSVPGGAATVLDVVVDPSRELRSLTVRALANEVVIGLMSATLERP